MLFAASGHSITRSLDPGPISIQVWGGAGKTGAYDGRLKQLLSTSLQQPCLSMTGMLHMVIVGAEDVPLFEADLTAKSTDAAAREVRAGGWRQSVAKQLTALWAV